MMLTKLMLTLKLKGNPTRRLKVSERDLLPPVGGAKASVVDAEVALDRKHTADLHTQVRDK